ncbi:MAG: c-type cytochrome [Myxococcota bacterium]
MIATALTLSCAGFSESSSESASGLSNPTAARISAGPETPKLGRAPAPDALLQVRIRIAPDGSNLPAGSGTAAEGEAVYVAHCLRCHGLGGAGKPADRLVGGMGSLAEPRPIKTVGSYWPRSAILFDYVRRAMPYDRPGSLSNREVYAIAAYLLAENQIIDAQAEMNAKTLPQVEMPNRDGFVADETTPFTGSPTPAQGRVSGER